MAILPNTLSLNAVRKAVISALQGSVMIGGSAVQVVSGVAAMADLRAGLCEPLSID